MSFSNEGEEIALGAVLEGTYVGLATTTPDKTSPGEEVTGGGYERQPWTPAYIQGDPTRAENASTIQFPLATGEWGQVAHAVIFSAETGGEYLGWLDLRNPVDPEIALPREIVPGDELRFPEGSLRFEIE